MIGKTISHYKIVDKLGEGGMGSVWKAEDTTLNRLVAIKALSSHLAENEEARERFIREAQAASSLNHANITTVHELFVDDGEQFIVMEYVDGKTLREMVGGGRISVKKAVDIILQAAEGLEAAHDEGILHRDVKSANIMVNEKGRVKVMDFGLAHLEERSQLTRTGTTIGTLAYSSPEQITGGSQDQRSDIYPLGVVLYELLTGELPFRGATEAEILFSIINKEPPKVSRLREEVPKGLEAVLDRMLEKDARLRYPSCEALITDLKAVRIELEPTPIHTTGAFEWIKAKYRKRAILAVTAVTVAAAGVYALFSLIRLHEPVALPRLAVLPFENLGSDEEEWFVNSITGEIANRIGGFRELGLISRDSSRRYLNSPKSSREIGEELDANYLLRGSVFRESSEDSGRILRISARLVRTHDDVEVWSDSYDEDSSEVFHIQSNIAEQVAEALAITIRGPHRRALEAYPTDNLEAYEYYLRGNDYYARRLAVNEAARLAVDMFDRAVELDPEFALAWAAGSEARTWLAWALDEWDELPKAKEAVDRAIQLEPELPNAHLAMGYYYGYGGSRDFEGALKEFEIARKSLPNDPMVVSAIGFIQRRQGKWKQAVTNLAKAAKLDSRTSGRYYEPGITCLVIREYAEAERYFVRAISLEPDLMWGYVEMALLYLLWEGNNEKAREVLQQTSEEMRSDIPLLAWDTHGRIVTRNLADFFIDYLDQSASSGQLDGDDLLGYYLARAETLGAINQPQLATVYYDSARVHLEAAAREDSLYRNDAVYNSQLGIAYAGVGLREEAIACGERAVELQPVSKDAFTGPERICDLAEIYLLVGSYDRAMDELEFLLKTASPLSRSLLRIDPRWNSLRELPRFQALLKRK